MPATKSWSQLVTPGEPVVAIQQPSSVEMKPISLDDIMSEQLAVHLSVDEKPETVVVENIAVDVNSAGPSTSTSHFNLGDFETFVV